MNEKGLLMVVSGPSGAGKSTVCDMFCSTHPEIGLSVSVTTRAPRNAEKDGEDYFFITHERFEEMAGKGELLEHASIYGNSYGTPREYVLDKLDASIDVMLEIEMQGAMQVKERYPRGIFVFIVPPTMDELYKRISGRGSESAESLHRRFSSAIGEMSYMEKYDYIVVNEKVEDTAATLEAILRAEHCRADRRIAMRDVFCDQAKKYTE